MKFPMFFSNYTAKIASASSLESFLKAPISKSATESIDDPVVQDRAQDYLQFFVQKVFADALKDGKIFFSTDPEVAYQELLDVIQLPDVKEAVIKEITAWPIDNELDRYKLLDNRLRNLKVEIGAREKSLDALKDAIITEHPDWEDEF